MGNSTVLAENLILGYTANRSNIITVDIYLDKIDHKIITVDHKEINRGVELSITGSAYRGDVDLDTLKKNIKGLDVFISESGQINNKLSDITNSDNLTIKEINRLQEIWKIHHLNGYQAGCAHQERLPSERDSDWGIANIKPCSETGYNWGSAWLYQPLPDGLLDELKLLISKASIT